MWGHSIKFAVGPYFAVKGLNFFRYFAGKGANFLQNFAEISKFVEISKFCARICARCLVFNSPISLFPSLLSFSKRGPVLRAVVAGHHGPLDVVGEGHVLVGSEERPEERKQALRCCRARRERKRYQRRLGPSTDLAKMVPVPPKGALGEVVDAAMVSGEPMRRGKEQREVSFKIRRSPPPRSIARGTTRASPRTEAESTVASCSETYDGPKSRSTRQMA